MNRVYNWIAIALVFFLTTIGVMTFTNHPAIAWAFSAPMFIALAMVAIRYDDHVKGATIPASGLVYVSGLGK